MSTIPNLKPGQHGCLEGTVFLSPWRGYASWDMRETNMVSDGHVMLFLGGMDEKDDNTVVTPEQVAAYEYAI